MRYFNEIATLAGRRQGQGRWRTVGILGVIGLGGIGLAATADFLRTGSALAQANPTSIETGAPANPFVSFAGVVEDVLPTVVSIRIRAQVPDIVGIPDDDPLAPFFRQFGLPQHQPFTYGEGSGFLISSDGFVVTNNHVVARAEEVIVTLQDGEDYPADVLGTDPRTDLALLKVRADRDFPFVTFADTPARVGDWVITVGNPFGLGGTVTAGIVSALGRDIGAGPYDDFIQIDAPINRGNSGGPAFNLVGEVVGVNTAIFAPTGGSVGIGFAIPTHIVTEVIADLRDDGIVERGWLGVRIQGIDEDIAAALGLDEARGALVVSTEPDSPAAEAGVRDGDAILAVDGIAVADTRDLSRTIAGHDPGEPVDITLWRDGAELTVEVVLAQLPGNDRPVTRLMGQRDEAPIDQGLGLSVAAATDVGAGRQGVAVIGVDPVGAAAAAGLSSGDVILEVGDGTVNTLQEFEDAIANARKAGAEAVLLRVRSNGTEGYRALTLN